MTHLTSLLPNDEALKEIPDKKFYLSMDFNRIDNYRFHDPTYYPMQSYDGYELKSELLTPQINFISNVLPPSPVLTQYGDIPKV